MAGEPKAKEMPRTMTVHETFKAVPVTDRIYWVGAVDRTVRDFHGYLTSRGTTYNAFLIVDDVVTLVDTVKKPFHDEMMARIASVIDPGKIRYVISNHSEMDHTGCLPDVIRSVRPEKLFASTMGAKAIEDHFHLGHPIEVVKDGLEVSLGKLSLVFAETRMCHWPDSMFSYVPQEQLLFSQDGFGMHLAGDHRFDDECDLAVMDVEAAKYYANILLPLSSFILKTLEKVGQLGWKLRIVAPDHGPIWRKHVDRIVGDYARWARQAPTDKAVVVFDTMWGSTREMARAVAEGLQAGGAQPRLMPLAESHRSDVATELLEAGALLVGSPTINNMLFPTLADTLSYLQGLKRKNLAGAAFGSHGWSGEGAKQVHEILTRMGVDLVQDKPLQCKYVPDENVLGQCRELGQAVAEKVKAKIAEAGA